MTQKRVKGIDHIFSNIAYIFRNTQYILVNTCSLFPKGLFGTLVVIIISFTIYNFIVANQKTALRNSLELITFTLISIMSSFVTFVLSLSSFDTGRLRFSIGATIGMLFIYLYCKTNIFEKKKLITYFMTFLLIFYSVFNVYNYISIMHQHKIVNILEKQDVAKIDDYIKKYEAENNIQVKYISDVVILGSLSKSFYDETPNKSVLTYSAIRCTWADVRSY